jgi:hypothetical protein
MNGGQLQFSFCRRCGVYLHPESGVARPDGIICGECEKVDLVNRVRLTIAAYLSGRAGERRTPPEGTPAGVGRRLSILRNPERFLEIGKNELLTRIY